MRVAGSVAVDVTARGQPREMSLRTRPPWDGRSRGCRRAGHGTAEEDVASVGVAARAAVGNGAADEAREGEDHAADEVT